MKEHKND